MSILTQPSFIRSNWWLKLTGPLLLAALGVGLFFHALAPATATPLTPAHVSALGLTAWPTTETRAGLNASTALAPATPYCTPPLCLASSSAENDLTYSVAWGDYDGDGDLDLAVGNGGNPSIGGGQPNRLYRNDGGVLTPSAVWSSAESDDTWSVAWGDVDGDGDLDLAVGNGGNLSGGQPNRLYRNNGGSLTTSAVWSSTESDKTNTVIWGDYDGDGDLDLAASNDGQPNRLYRNEGGSLTASAVWSSTEVAIGRSAAWGDVDSDGDLDLTVGNFNGRTRLYRNDGGALTASAVWSSTVDHFTTSVAWGDYDNDGDPDLALAGWGNPNQLYRNDGGTLTANAVWSSTEGANTRNVAWGDMDGDGDLDLAVGNAGYGGLGGQPNRLYRNDNGVLTASAVWASPESDNSFGVAWGDIDGDGDLDLAVGNYGQPNRLYRNGGGALTNSAVWSSTETDDTYSVAWGDVDGDGDLDLAVGNYGAGLGEPNRLYRNASGVLMPSAVWSSTESDKTFSVAWGDVDGDGDLDLAVGNFQQPNRLYRNDGGALTSSAVWSSTESDQTYSVAWGDVDGDGDLDLAVGNDGPNRLYRNDGGTLTTSAVWSSTGGGGTRSVAWGDVDGDGDLDLAAGRGSQNHLYRNDRGTLTTNPAWSSAESDNTFSVAWGDVDGDGDLDLAVGNYSEEGQPNRLYRNDGRTLTTNAVWSSTENDGTWSVAWGDADGDGDLDLAVGNGGVFSGQPNRLYQNDGGMLTTSAVWSSTENDRTMSVAWGDVDGDGDLDLAVGNYDQFSSPVPNRLYHTNDGGANPRQPFNQLPQTSLTRPGPTQNGNFFSSPAIQSGAIIPITYTLADAEGDPIRNLRAFYSPNGGGQWYPAVAASGTLTRNLSPLGALAIETSLTNTLVAIPDQARITSTLSMTFPQTIADVDVRVNLTHTSDNHLVITLTAPTGYAVQLVAGRGGSGDDFTNTIFDDEASTPIGSGTAPFTGRYQPEQRLAILDGLAAKGAWKLVVQDTQAGEVGTLLGWEITLTLRSGAVYTYAWDVSQSGFFGQTDNMVFRLEAYPSPFSTTVSVTGTYRYTRTAPIYLYSLASAATFPFRVRGTQVQVISNSVPVSNAVVYRLSSGQLNGALPFADGAGQAYRTDVNGYLQGRGQLNVGDRLMALYPLSATSAYTVYATSALPTVSGLAMYTVTTGGVQTLSVSATKPLVLFDISVSLEWDARQDTSFLKQLEFDLGRTSEFLYDWTNGQVALGNITLYHNREHWNDAHVRLYGTNGLHPNADQGGVVRSSLVETATSNLGVTNTVTYRPGQVRMAAVWSRFGAGAVGEDWPRTLAHELGHYLLFQDDAYIGANAQGQFYPLAQCAGTAMTDPYREDYSEFKLPTEWSPTCDETLAARTTGRSEWATLLKFYPALTATANPGPAVLPLAVTQIRYSNPTTPTAALAVPVFYLTSGGGRYVARATAKAVLYQPDQKRLLDLGHPVDDRVQAYGARPGDRLCVYDADARKLGCEPVTAGDTQLNLTDLAANWQPDIIVTPVNSRTIELYVGNAPPSVTLQAQIYPNDGAASAVITPTERSPGVYISTVALDAPTLAAHVVVWVAEPEPRREALSAYAVGGNPVGKPKPPPNRAPVNSNDGEVTLYTLANFPVGEFYALQRATYVPPIPAWLTLVGPGYRIVKSAGAPSLSQSAISFNYDQSAAPPGEENFLQVYYYQNGAWTPLTTTLDTGRNAALAPTQDAGLYALLASFQVSLPAAGWNLFAYPVQATRSVTEALLSISGNYTTVYGYVVTDTVNPWRIYDVQAASKGYVNDLTMLEFGKGYWINVSAAAVLKLTGGTGQTPALPTNAPSFSMPPMTVYGTLQASANFTPTAGMTVTAWVNGVACGQTVTRAYAGQVVYVLKVLADGAGNEGCGATGRTITLKTSGATLGSPAWGMGTVTETALAKQPEKLYFPLIRR